MTTPQRLATTAAAERSTGATVPRGEASVTGPSIHVIRARKLLFGGLVGGLAATVISLRAVRPRWTAPAVWLSAALAAAMVLFFYGVGQLVMVAFADAGARTLLAVSMASYTARVVVLGLVLAHLQQALATDFPALSPMAIFVTTIAVVAGWMVVEIWVFSRLRIGVYDTEYVSPTVDEGEQ